jgi:hypothetical protein
MGKFVRTCIAIIMLLSVILLARNNVAWAATSASQDDQSSMTEAELSAALDRDKDCDKDRNKDKDKCKCKDKDNCGSVRPPVDSLKICEPGLYSVGGVATLDVKKLQDRDQKPDCFYAHVEDGEDVGGIGKKDGRVLSDQIVLTSVGQGSIIRICFAAPPSKKVTIYFSAGGSWKALGTQVKDGMACAQVPDSGSFVLFGK